MRNPRDDFDYEEYDDGLLCRHEYDPVSCMAPCHCEHECREHYFAAAIGETACHADGCDCTEFEES